MHLRQCFIYILTPQALFLQRFIRKAVPSLIHHPLGHWAVSSLLRPYLAPQAVTYLCPHYPLLHLLLALLTIAYLLRPLQLWLSQLPAPHIPLHQLLPQLHLLQPLLAPQVVMCLCPLLFSLHLLQPHLAPQVVMCLYTLLPSFHLFHQLLAPSGIRVPPSTPRSSYTHAPPSTLTSVSGDYMPHDATPTSVPSTPNSSSPSVLTKFIVYPTSENKS